MRLIVDDNLLPPSGAEPIAIATQPAAQAPANPAKTVPITPPVPATQPARLPIAPTSRPAPVQENDAVGVENFLSLAGPTLPDLFQHHDELEYAKDGLVLHPDMRVRTKRADYADVDFTFDVIFHFRTARDRLLLGFGDEGGARGSTAKSVVCQLDGSGSSRVDLGHHHDMPLGTYEGFGPHLVRLQKRGPALTFELFPEFKPGASPSFIKTLPDLFAIAPEMGGKNSTLFFGNGGVIEKTRLTIDSEPPEATHVAVDLPPRIIAGQPLHRSIAGAGSALQFSTLDAPKGLTLSAQGQLDWTPGGDQLGANEFTIIMTAAGRRAVRPIVIEVVSPQDAQAVGGDLTKVDALRRLAMQDGNFRIAPGLGGNSLLLLQGQTLRRLGPDGITPLQTWKLPHPCQWIGERDAYFVTLSDETKSLDLVDKVLMKVTQSLPMDYERRWDLCLHPRQQLSYVSVSGDARDEGDEPILIVDEKSGDVHQPEEFRGTFLQISSDGSRLVAGCKNNASIYEKRASRLIIYDVSQPNHPVKIASRGNVGFDGFGLAMSADGKRISFLAEADHRRSSPSILAWDADDLSRRPVAYRLKGGGKDHRRVAFHRTLPIAATLTKDGAVCYERDSGKEEPHRLEFRPLAGGSRPTDLIFSPDGRSLILACQGDGEQFLYRAPLSLSAEEAAKLGDAPNHP